MATRNDPSKPDDPQTQGQLSSQDPAEGRPDVPKGKGADKGKKYDVDKYFRQDEPTQSSDEPVEGSRDAGKS